MRHRYVLHSIQRTQYEKEKANGCIGQQSINDCGFVHCSDLDTYALVAPNFKDDSSQRVLLVIDIVRLSSSIRWEDGGGLDFPHIYGPINEEAITEVVDHLWSEDRVWIPNHELDPYRNNDERKVRKLAIVSLSSGTIGEDFVSHEVKRGLKRLEAMGLEVRMMPHAQKGIEYVRNHPAERAQDLLEAMKDDSVDMILCAIGGDDTYRLLPYLYENDELKKAVKQKIFLGFSDTTMNHFMLHNVGLNTFYGQSFLADICEMEPMLLPYSAHYFDELIATGTIREIRPSDVWYEERKDWSEAALDTPRKKHENHGFERLQGPAVFEGEILGGCLESMFDIWDNSRYEDTTTVCEKYHLFPSLEDWKGKILLIETSEEQPSPKHYREMLQAMKKTGVFGVISGILCGKPMDEMFFAEYKQMIMDVVDDPALPIVANVNIGHATPRCIIPFGVHAVVDADRQVIRFSNK